jgi:hypothetical protein
MDRDHGLALQATVLVEPAHKLQSLVLSSGRVIVTLLIERFDSTEVNNLLARKTHAFEIPHFYPVEELLS